MPSKIEKYIFFAIPVVTLLFFFEPITREINFYFRDLHQWTYPAKNFFVEEIQNGRFPLWDPYQYKGLPYAANISMSVYYPLNIIFLILPLNDACKYFIILHYFLFGTFSYMFMRSIKISSFSSAYASVSLMFSGYLLSLHCESNYLQSAIWFPLILLFYLKALQNNGRFRYILFTASALALQLFAGNPQDVLISVFFMFIIGAAHIFLSSQKQHKTKTCFKVLLFVGIISLGLSAIQLFPALELTSLSSRHGGVPLISATTWSFHPVRLIELLFPFPFGKILPDMATYYGRSLINCPHHLPWALTTYMGLLPLFFIPMSLIRGNRTAYLFTFFFIFFLLVSFGKYTPLYYICYKILPGFNLFRYPEKYLFPTTFSMGILCALGCDAYLKYLFLQNKLLLLKRQPKENLKKLKIFYTWVKRISLVIVGTISATYLVMLIFKKNELAFLDSLFKKNNIIMSSNLAFMVIEENFIHFIVFSFLAVFFFYFYKKRMIKKTTFLALLFASLFVDISTANREQLALTSYYVYDFVPPLAAKIKNNSPKNDFFRIHQSQNIKYPSIFTKNNIMINGSWEHRTVWKKNVLCKNWGLVYHLSYSWGYQPLVEKDYEVFFKKIQTDRLFSLLNVKYIIETTDDTYYKHNQNYELIYSSKKDRIKVFENKTCFNRVFLVDNAVYFDNKQELLKTILKKDFDFSHTVAIESQTHYQPEKSGGSLSEKSVCKIVEYKPNYIRINASVEKDCFLVLSDSYYPGWKAYVDGKEEPILKANYVLRALFMKTGTHVVEFRYQPLSFKVGGIISLFTLFLLTGFSLYTWLKRPDQLEGDK